MKIYGFFAGSHDPTIAYLEDGEIKCVIQEERIKRVKSGDDYPQSPWMAKDAIERETGVPMKDADFIACATPTGYEFIANSDLPKIGIRSFGHQECHAVGAYMTSGFEGRCIAVTYDGGGDDSYGSIWLCEDGKMDLVKDLKIAEHASLGRLWMTITSHMGWKILKDEGKVMGMAGNGRPNDRLYRLLSTVCRYEGSLSFGPRASQKKMEQVASHLSREGWFSDRERRFDVAYALQKLTEDIMTEFVGDLIREYPEWSKKICFAGGLFANVKMNQKINEMPEIDEIWVMPPMGDEGLALGAAITMSMQRGEWTKPKRIPNMFYGLAYSQARISEAAAPYGFIEEERDFSKIACLLAEGKIGAFFNGRFEYGPRSLGARSIVVQATDRSTHDLLNERLERHEVMPFAPVVMKEKASEVFEGAEKSSYAAEFMTCCYTVREEWRERIPACIHAVDNTGRPQVANAETNPEWHSLVEAYYDKTGIPVLLNTSFNGHGEPIIDTPEQAFAHLEKGTIDFLIMEKKTYYKK